MLMMVPLWGTHYISVYKKNFERKKEAAQYYKDNMF